jgi:hypothetical protein
MNLSIRFDLNLSVHITMSSNLNQPIPAFDDLPLRSGDPHHSAWGLWKDPALGALNHLTDEVVLRAAKEELRTGERVTMKYASNIPVLYGRLH